MDRNVIGNKIRDLRNDRRMTQKELSIALSVAASTISHWEKGRRQPSISELRRIAEYFNVSLNAFGYNYELEDRTVFQPERIDSTQIIRAFTPGFRIRLRCIYLYAIGSILSLSSICFFSSWSEGVLLLGSLILLIPLIALFLHIIRSISKPVRSFATPATTTVYFEHKEDGEYVAEFKDKIMVLSTVLVFSSIVLQSSISLLFSDLTDPIESLLIVLYGLMAIIVTYMRRLTLSNSPVLNKQVNYHRSPHRLSHGILYLNWLLDLFTFIALVILLSRLGNDTNAIIRILTSVIAMLQAGVSYHIIRTYNAFIMGFRMFAVGVDQEVYRIH
ncbi:MAG: helix-turn-helix domain-containing protein [Acholeplasmataceae bacterium]